MAFVRKIKGSLVKLDSADYVGEESYLFYDIDTACIRITDGTPGGRPACIEGTAGSLAWGNITGDINLQTDLQPRLVEQSTVTITPGATVTVITTSPIANLGTKYLITVVDTVDGRVSASEVMASYKALDDTVSHNHYSKIGDKIKYRPAVAYTAPNVEFIVTNNDTNTITVSVTRIPTLSV